MGIKRLFLCILLILLTGRSIVSAQPALKQYRIALLLPFHTGGYKGSLGEAMLDYYSGFKAAAQNLESEGLKLTLYVFDSEKDSNSLTSALEHPDMAKMNLIIGPVYDKEMAVVEAFCSEHKIPLVSPLKFCKPKNKESAMVNFFVPDSVRIASVAARALRLYPGYKIYLATDNSVKSKDYSGIIKRELIRQNRKNSKMLIYTGAAIGATALPKDSVLVFSTIAGTGSREPLLKAVKQRKNAVLIAHTDWHNPSMSTFGMDEPRLLWPDVNFIASDSSAVQFRRNFMEIQYSEPSKYAFIGYDQGTYLCYSLMAFGSDFINHLPNADFRGTINIIHLENSKNGIINTGINFIRIVEENRQEFAP